MNIDRKIVMMLGRTRGHHECGPYKLVPPVSREGRYESCPYKTGKTQMGQGRSDTSKLRIFNRSRWQKTSRYAVSGLVVIMISSILTAYGLIFSNGNYGS